MPRYRVRAPFRHEGVEYLPGSFIELPRRLVREFPHLVDEVDATGAVLVTAVPTWRLALEGVRDHERASILIEQRALALQAATSIQQVADDAETEAKDRHAEALTAQAVVKDIDKALAALSEPTKSAPKAGAKE